jgi:predicted nucleic acid-binding protein
MRLLDTSIVVRYITGDVPRLAMQAGKVIESPEVLGLSPVVLLEAWHVLRRYPYELERDEIIHALIRLTRRRNIQAVGVANDHLAVAMSRCLGSNAVNIGDALLAATGWSHGVTEIYTFDRRFARAGLDAAPMPDDGSSH